MHQSTEKGIGLHIGPSPSVRGNDGSRHDVIVIGGGQAGLAMGCIDVLGELEPKHVGGVVPDVPCLYFVGLMFFYAGQSVMVHGVSRDAARIANVIAQHSAG